MNFLEEIIYMKTSKMTVIGLRPWIETAPLSVELSREQQIALVRTYVRQGVEQIPTVLIGVAATQMEYRSIPTEKGSVNREFIFSFKSAIIDSNKNAISCRKSS